MPNPFPGMNPYLEDVELWKGVHNSLIEKSADALDQILPPRYFVTTETRVVLEPMSRGFYPDVWVGEGIETPRREATALLEADEAVIVVVEEEEELYLTLRHSEAPDDVVTVIEFLSPTNKSVHRDEYLQKQRLWLDSNAHLLEVDLLRAGKPTVAPFRDAALALRPAHYVCSLHRAGAAGRFEIWPRSVRQPLPRVAVPLRPQDGQVALDLNPLIEAHYERRRLHFRIDYRREPAPPLEGEDGVWLDARLRELGLR